MYPLLAHVVVDVRLPFRSFFVKISEVMKIL